ncbi:TMEM63 [Acanthosepion pharaonis]|uniref:TMEM63 n=1 Tax=Acanthosepion pharaonis TaxID=158019 RepID=A0A812C019_ACAPH|nr:TMEM63 [Sepia pharaonis]
MCVCVCLSLSLSLSLYLIKSVHIYLCHFLIFLFVPWFLAASVFPKKQKQGGWCGGAHLFSVSSPLPPPIDCKFIIYCFFFSFLRLPTTVTFCPVLSCPLSVSLSNPQIDQEVNTVQINAIHNKKCDTSRVLLPNPAPHFPTRAPPVPAHGRN